MRSASGHRPAKAGNLSTLLAQPLMLRRKLERHLHDDIAALGMAIMKGRD